MISDQVTATYLLRIAEIEPIIRDNIGWSQRERRLATPVVEAFHDAGLFRLMTPTDLGGAGLEEYELAPIIEAVACIDASAAWNLAIGNGALGMVRDLDESEVSGILSAPNALGAAVASPGTVSLKEIAGGFVVSGRAGFASGCSHANWLVIVGMLADEDGVPVFGPNGAPSLRKAVLPMDQVEILDTWHVTGLRGTGSSDVVFRDIFVPAARVTDPGITLPSRFVPLGVIPTFTRLGSELTPVAIGAVVHSIIELQMLAASKPNLGTPSLIRDRADVQNALGRATGLVQAARATVQEVSSRVAEKARQDIAPTIDDLMAIRLSYVTATELCVTAVDLIHAAAGSSTLSDESVIGRCWRDVHAVSQHISQQRKHYENAGRVMLGLAPQGPI